MYKLKKEINLIKHKMMKILPTARKPVDER